ncbi:MAG: sugar-binding protein [Spirochaetota bacterium]
MKKLIVIGIVAAYCFAQAPLPVPRIEFLFDGDLKNSGTLGGEGRCQNPVTGEEAGFGSGMMNGCLDLSRVRGGLADKANAHGGTVLFPAKGLEGSSMITIIGSFYPMTADDLPRCIVTMFPLKIYAQSGALICSVANMKNEVKYVGTKISVISNVPVMFACVLDSRNNTITAYQYKSRALVKTMMESGLPNGAVVSPGNLEVGNSGGIRPFKGFIDNVRIYDSILTETVISDIMAKDRSAYAEPSSLALNAAIAPVAAPAGAVSAASIPLPANRYIIDPAKGSPLTGWELIFFRPGVSGTLAPLNDADKHTARGDLAFEDKVKDNDAFVYARLSRNIEKLGAEGLSFSMLVSDTRIRCTVIVADQSGQNHSLDLKIPTGNEWQTIRLPFDKRVFINHWSGDNDGKIKFPVTSLSLLIYRGTLPSPGKAFLLIKDTAVYTRSVSPAAKFDLTIENEFPSGVAFVGDRAVYRVTVMHRMDGPTSAELGLRIKNDDGVLEEKQYPLSFTSGGETITKDIPLSAREPGYYGILASISENGQLFVRTKSALAVVNKPPNYGKEDSNSFYGLMAVNHDPEAAERIGCKNYREFFNFSGWTPQDPEKNTILATYDKRINAARAHGMQVVLCPEINYMSLPTNWGVHNTSDLLKPEVMQHYRNHIRFMVERYKDTVAAFEIQNEPDSEIAYLFNHSVEKGAEIYAAMVRVASEEIRKAAPNARILALDCGRDYRSFPGADEKQFPGDLKFAKAVMPQTKGMFDIHSGHPYSYSRIIRPGVKVEMPEDMNLRGLLMAAGDLMVKHGFPRRLWPTEFGYSILGTTEPPDEMSLLYAAALGQGMTICKSVPGLEKAFWFIFHWHNPTGDDYGLFSDNLSQRSPESPTSLKFPSPGAAVYAAHANILHDSKFVREIKLGDTFSAWRFDRADGKSAICLWSKHDGEYQLQFSGSSSVEAYNAYGKRVAQGPAIAATFSRLLTYFVAPINEADALERSMSTGKMSATQPLMVRKAGLSGDREVTVVLENTTGRPVKAVFELAGRTSEHDLSSSISNKIIVPLSRPVRPNEPLALSLTAEVMKKKVPIKTDFITAGYIAAPGIDGDISEASSLEALSLDNRNYLFPPDAEWKGTNDLSVTAYVGWNDEGLYFAARVLDNRHEVPFDGPKESWKSDSIQLGLDYECDSTHGYNADDREIGLVIGHSGGRASLYIANVYWGPCAALVAGGHKDGVTIYEALIPWKELRHEPPKAGKMMPFNFIVNENDGMGRSSWMGLTPGIGEGKAPINFRSFLFSK